MNRDKRGVPRGRCSCGECDAYIVPKDGDRCEYCECVPTKHANLKQQGVTSPDSPSESHFQNVTDSRPHDNIDSIKKEVTQQEDVCSTDPQTASEAPRVYKEGNASDATHAPSKSGRSYEIQSLAKSSVPVVDSSSDISTPNVSSAQKETARKRQADPGQRSDTKQNSKKRKQSAVVVPSRQDRARVPQIEMRPCKLLHMSHLPYTEIPPTRGGNKIMGWYKIAYNWKTIYIGKSSDCIFKQLSRQFNGTGQPDLFQFLKGLDKTQLENVSVYWLNEAEFTHSCGKKSYLECITKLQGEKPRFKGKNMSAKSNISETISKNKGDKGSRDAPNMQNTAGHHSPEKSDLHVDGVKKQTTFSNNMNVEKQELILLKFGQSTSKDIGNFEVPNMPKPCSQAKDVSQKTLDNVKKQTDKMTNDKPLSKELPSTANDKEDHGKAGVPNVFKFDKNNTHNRSVPQVEAAEKDLHAVKKRMSSSSDKHDLNISKELKSTSKISNSNRNGTDIVKEKLITSKISNSNRNGTDIVKEKLITVKPILMKESPGTLMENIPDQGKAKCQSSEASTSGTTTQSRESGNQQSRKVKEQPLMQEKRRSLAEILPRSAAFIKRTSEEKGSDTSFSDHLSSSNVTAANQHNVPVKATTGNGCSAVDKVSTKQSMSTCYSKSSVTDVTSQTSTRGCPVKSQYTKTSTNAELKTKNINKMASSFLSNILNNMTIPVGNLGNNQPKVEGKKAAQTEDKNRSEKQLQRVSLQYHSGVQRDPAPVSGQTDQRGGKKLDDRQRIGFEEALGGMTYGSGEVQPNFGPLQKRKHTDDATYRGRETFNSHSSRCQPGEDFCNEETNRNSYSESLDAKISGQGRRSPRTESVHSSRQRSRSRDPDGDRKHHHRSGHSGDRHGDRRDRDREESRNFPRDHMKSAASFSVSDSSGYRHGTSSQSRSWVSDDELPDIRPPRLVKDYRHTSSRPQ